MKVNFGNLNFGRAIKIQTNLDNIKGKNPDYALENVIASLYGTLSESSIYDSETSKEIGAFLRAQIGDFDSNERTLYLRKLGNDRYLFTGNEAVKVRKLDGMYLYQMSEYKAKEKEALSDSSSMQEIADYKERCNEYKEEMDREKEEKLLEMVEDGTYGKDKSEIVLNFDDENKLTEMQYRSSASKGTKLRTIQNILAL